MKIWKYPLQFVDEQKVTMPIMAEIIHFGNQNEIPTLWVLVDPLEQNLYERTIRIAGTGHEIVQLREDVRFLGTAIFGDGVLVFHAFEVFEHEEYEVTG